LILILIFLHARLEELNKHEILLGLQSPLDYVLLLVSIIIRKEFIQEKRQFIIKNNNEEKQFVNKLRNRLGAIEMTNITSCEMPESITQEFATIVKDLWDKFSKMVNITK